MVTYSQVSCDWINEIFLALLGQSLGIGIYDMWYIAD